MDSFGFLYTRVDPPSEQLALPPNAFLMPGSQEAVVEFLNETENEGTYDMVGAPMSAPGAVGDVMGKVMLLHREHTLQMNEINLRMNQQFALQLQELGLSATATKRQRTSSNPPKTIESKRLRTGSNPIEEKGALDGSTPARNRQPCPDPSEWITECPIYLTAVTREQIYIYGW